jgi:hypothetical protein
VHNSAATLLETSFVDRYEIRADLLPPLEQFRPAFCLCVADGFDFIHDCGRFSTSTPFDFLFADRGLRMIGTDQRLQLLNLALLLC